MTSIRPRNEEDLVDKWDDVLTSYEHYDEDHETNASLFVNLSVSSEYHKEKDVTKILESIRSSDSLEEDVN